MVTWTRPRLNPRPCAQIVTGLGAAAPHVLVEMREDLVAGCDRDLDTGYDPVTHPELVERLAAARLPTPAVAIVSSASRWCTDRGDD